jgi:2-dehydropantoate 2-reductase
VRFCVVGAGAIGGVLAANLARAGAEVTAVARGAHLARIRDRGLTLREEGSEEVVRVRAVDRVGEAGPQDVIFLAVKAHQVAAVAAEVAAAAGPGTTIVTAQNGIPWWYFFKLGGPHEGTRLESVDPGGAIAKSLDVDKVVGSVVYAAAEMAEPGVIRHLEGKRITLGELDGSEKPRTVALVEALRRAGFTSRVASDIRSDIWVKLWGNCSFNPISALTQATLGTICTFPPTRALTIEMMREAQVIGEKLGASFGVSIERRIAGAESVGAHKTSMLQDVQAGRPIELEALLGSVVELGRITETPTPSLSAIYAAASLLAHTLAERAGRLRVEPVG